MQMSAEIRVRVAADAAWELLGDRFGDIAVWASPITASAMDADAVRVGAVRTCHVAGFGPVGRTVLRERLLSFDAAGRSLTYDAVAGMPPFVRAAANTWTVEPDGPGACVVRTRAELRLAWWVRPLGPVLGARFGSDATGVLEELAHHLETGRPHPRKATARAGAPVAGDRAPTVER